MTPLSLTDQQRLVLAYSPHLTRLLDALNVRGDLHVLDLNPDRTTVDVLQIESRVQGLHPSEALAWARGHSQAPLLRVHAPTARFRASTLWFGKVQFEGLPDAYLRLEVPLESIVTPSAQALAEDATWLVLTSHADATVLDAWAKQERERLAEESVTQYLEPVMLQLESFGYEAIALGWRAALLKLPPVRATDLLARTVPVLMTAWVLAWREAIAARAPGLRGVEGEVVLEHSEESVQAQICQMGSSHAAPCVHRMQLIGSPGEPMWVWHAQRETHFEEKPQELERLRVLTGAALASVEDAVAFLEELEAFVLIHLQAHGTTRIEWTVASHSRGYVH
jgi:hypothetical protein